MRSQYFQNLPCKYVPTRFQEKIVSPQKLKKTIPKKNWRCTKNANATGEKAQAKNCKLPTYYANNKSSRCLSLESWTDLCG